MPIPNFEPNGLLPAGRYVATDVEIEADLVTAFPTSTRRAFILQRWRLLRHVLVDLLKVHEQWIDGSFAENKTDPGDIDIVTVYDGPAFDALTPEERILPESLMYGHWTGRLWKCDSFGVALYPPGHPQWGACQQMVEYWHNWWGHTRPTDPRGHVPKGYVVVQ